MELGYAERKKGEEEAGVLDLGAAIYLLYSLHCKLTVPLNLKIKKEESILLVSSLCPLSHNRFSTT